MKQYLNHAYAKHNNNTLPYSLNPIYKSKTDFGPDQFYEDLIKLATSEYGKTIYDLFKFDKIYDSLIGNAGQHGIFVREFFDRELSIHVKRKIIEDEIDLESYYPLYCNQYNFGTYEKVKKYLPQNFASDFCKVALYYLNDEVVYSIIRNWQAQNSIIRNCEICGKEYRIAFFRDWVYYGANGNTTVCFECPFNTESTEEEILRLIPKLIENCGFIPNADFSPININFSSRIKPENWTSSLKVIFQMGNWRDFFDSWFKALVKSKVLKDDIIITSRGVKCIAKSGNECNSLDELFIDNWLFEQGYDVKKEPLYPKHKTYNSSGRKRADWLVNGHYIEYFGLAGDEIYDKKVIDKIKLAKDLDLKLISIFPKDLNLIDNTLRLLRE